MQGSEQPLVPDEMAEVPEGHYGSFSAEEATAIALEIRRDLRAKGLTRFAYFRQAMLPPAKIAELYDAVEPHLSGSAHVQVAQAYGALSSYSITGMEEGEGKSDPTSRASPDKRAEEVEGEPQVRVAAPHEGATSATAAKALFSGLVVSDEEQEEEECAPLSELLTTFLAPIDQRRPCLSSKSVCTKGCRCRSLPSKRRSRLRSWS